MLTIGEFSRICFVTRKTLRHYDEIGLLRPDHIADNGYRYYTTDQFRTMRLISRLKAYGFSLPEIAAHLANPDEQLLVSKLNEKQKLMQSGLESAERMLRQMEQDIDKLKRSIDIMDANIVVKPVERTPMSVLGVRKSISVDPQHFGELFNEVYALLASRGLKPLGEPMAFYHDEDFKQEHSDIEVAVPVAKGIQGSRVVEGKTHATATLVGPYEPDAFTAIYAEVCKWIEENSYHMTGAPFDVYVKGGPEVDPKDYITEVYFPIEK